MIGNPSASAVVTRDLRSALVEATFLQDRLAKLQESVQALNAEVEYLRGERAAVVAWLRKRHADTQVSDGFEDMYDSAVSRTYRRAADTIERGDHRREGEP